MKQNPISKEEMEKLEILGIRWSNNTTEELVSAWNHLFNSHYKEKKFSNYNLFELITVTAELYKRHIEPLYSKVYDDITLFTWEEVPDGVSNSVGETEKPNSTTS